MVFTLVFWEKSSGRIKIPKTRKRENVRKNIYKKKKTTLA